MACYWVTPRLLNYSTSWHHLLTLHPLSQQIVFSQLLREGCTYSSFTLHPFQLLIHPVIDWVSRQDHGYSVAPFQFIVGRLGWLSSK